MGIPLLYGTLRDPAEQQATFGRELAGRDNALCGGDVTRRSASRSTSSPGVNCNVPRIGLYDCSRRMIGSPPVRNRVNAARGLHERR
jgi:hypothetical protein